MPPSSAPCLSWSPSSFAIAIFHDDQGLTSADIGPTIEHMFDQRHDVIGLSEGFPGGEGDEARAGDEAAYRLTMTELACEPVEPERHLLPEDVEDLEPGLFLAAIAASVDRSKLNGHDAVRLMQAEERLAAHYEASKLASMAEVAHSPGGGPRSPVERGTDAIEYASDEIAAALTLTRRSADNELESALSLTGQLVRVWRALQDGQIDMRKARTFVTQLDHLRSEIIDAVLDRVLDDAGNMTTGQLRARVSRLVMELDPEGVEIGHRAGLEDRKVTTHANPDATASVVISSVPPDDAARAVDRVNRIAWSLKTGAEPRTLDQLRADVAIDLLMGRTASADTACSAGGVVLKVDLATLAELSNAPGDLAGYGPVLADVARKTARETVDGKWSFVVTDEEGRFLKTGLTGRRPTASLRRHVEAEYETCTFVGCRMPAYQCDLDHRKPFSQGGPTHNDNMEPLCRHHHMAKHHAPWSLQRLPNGDHRWTSPLGHTYVRARAPPA